MTDLISKRNRNAFREIFVDWTLAQIRTEFDNEGFGADADYIPSGIGGQRRQLVEQIYHAIDFTDHRHMARLLEVYQTVLAQLRTQSPSAAEPLMEHLQRDGVVVDEVTLRLPAQAGPSGLGPLSAMADVMTADQLHAQIRRIEASIETDPALAIGTAKELVETTCKTILADLDQIPGAVDLGDLVKLVLKNLKLLPDDVPNEAKGADAIRKTLRSLTATVAEIAEMRNYYGSGHGQDGRARGLTPRHARLAVGAATTLAVFLFDTFAARRT